MYEAIPDKSAEGYYYQSHLFISPCTSQDRNWVVSAIKVYEESLPGNVNCVHYFSDGGEFKNRFIADWIASPSDHLTSRSWNYWATDHGIGPWDGEGWQLKRAVNVVNAGVFSHVFTISRQRHPRRVKNLCKFVICFSFSWAPGPKTFFADFFTSFLCAFFVPYSYAYHFGARGAPFPGTRTTLRFLSNAPLEGQRFDLACEDSQSQ